MKCAPSSVAGNHLLAMGRKSALPTLQSFWEASDSTGSVKRLLLRKHSARGAGACL